MPGDERPPADPMRTQMAQQMFSEGTSPEEYAARNAHSIMCFSLDDIRYADPALDAWIQRLGDILFQREGAPKLADLHARYLTPQERLEAEREREDF